MSQAADRRRGPAPADRDRSDRPPPAPEVAAAIAEVTAARVALQASLDDLVDAGRSAVDLPAKVRRNPGKTLALVGGAGFLVAGGPRRVLRAVSDRVVPPGKRRDRHEGLLPDEIEKVLKDSKVAKDPAVRRAIEKDFAEYLRKKGKVAEEQAPAAVLWRTFDRVAGPLGTAGARLLVMRLMQAEKTRARVRAEEDERRRQRSTERSRRG